MSKAKSKKRSKSTPGNARHTLTALAQEHGVTRTVLNSAIESGGLPSELFPFDDRGRRSIKNYKEASAKLKAFLGNPPKLGRPSGVTVSLNGPELPPNFDVEDPETWPLDLEGLKMVREWWIARQAKRKDDLAAGELVRAEDMRRELFSAARVVRDQLLKIPDGAAADVAAEVGVADVDQVRRILRSSIERGLHDLSAALSAVVANQSEGTDAKGAHAS